MPSTPATAGVYSPRMPSTPATAGVYSPRMPSTPATAGVYSPRMPSTPATAGVNPPRQIYHICRRQMSIPSPNLSHLPQADVYSLAKSITSAVGRCLFPLAIYGEGVADRPGVRSKLQTKPPKTKKARHKGGLRCFTD